MSQNIASSIELTNRIQAGSRSAEAEFAETYSRSLMILLLNKTRDLDSAKDCCQQTLMITLTKIRAGRISRPESLPSFLRHTAVNVAITYYRKEKRFTQLSDRFFSMIVAPGNTAARDKDFDTVRLMLNDALDLLPVERDREVLQRLYLQEEDRTLIQRDLGLSSAHFDRVVYRAKKRLRQLLNSHEDMKCLFLQSLSKGFQEHRTETCPIFGL